MSVPQSSLPTPQSPFVVLKTAAIWLGTATAFFLLWYLRQAILIAFAAILLSLLLRTMTRLICRIVAIPRAAALAISVLFVVLIVGVTFYLFGYAIAGQMNDVLRQARSGLATLEADLKSNGIDISSLGRSGMAITEEIPSVLMSGIAAAEILIVIAIAAIYLAAQPAMYRDGVAMLFPRRLQAKGIEALDLIGTSLRLWMVGQFILMVIVGVLTYAALWLLGVPSPIALALIAGLAEAVPYLGPFIGAIPALLVALTKGVDLALWAGVLYLGVHMIEGYLCAPLLHRYFVRLPPAMVLIGIFISQLLFGFMGVVLAAPIVAAIFTAVKVLYVRNALHKPAEIPDHAPV